MSRFGSFLVAATLLTACIPPPGEPPAAINLQADGEHARAERLPIVLFFHSRACPFCREVEEFYLRPLLNDNLRRPRFILRAVEVDQAWMLRDFAGRATDMRAFARAQGVTLVPHLRFLGPDGAPLAPDLRGIASRDFYAGYLEDAIAGAGAKMLRK
jgi:hypothetical protein